MRATEAKFRAELERFLSRFAMGSAYTYRLPIERFLGTTRGDLAPKAIARYLATLDGQAPATRAKGISAVRSFLQHCMARGLVPWCPIDALGLERPKITRDPARRTLHVDELEALMAAAQAMGAREHAAVWLLGSTGLRATELVNARWGDLDRDDVTGVYVLDVKTLKGGPPRRVEIVPDLFALLASLHGGRALRRADKRPLLGRAYARVTLHRMLRRIAAKAWGPNPRVDLSTLFFRHTAFTLVARANASAHAIRKMAGHARLETSQAYVDLGQGMAASPTRLLPEFMLGPNYTAPKAV